MRRGSALVGGEVEGVNAISNGVIIIIIMERMWNGMNHHPPPRHFQFGELRGYSRPFVLLLHLIPCVDLPWNTRSQMKRRTCSSICSSPFFLRHNDDCDSVLIVDLILHFDTRQQQEEDSRSFCSGHNRATTTARDLKIELLPNGFVSISFSSSLPSPLPFNFPHSSFAPPTHRLHFPGNYSRSLSWYAQWVRYNKRSVTTSGIFNLNFAIYMGTVCVGGWNGSHSWIRRWNMSHCSAILPLSPLPPLLLLAPSPLCLSPGGSRPTETSFVGIVARK